MLYPKNYVDFQNCFMYNMNMVIFSLTKEN